MKQVGTNTAQVIQMPLKPRDQFPTPHGRIILCLMDYFQRTGRSTITTDEVAQLTGLDVETAHACLVDIQRAGGVSKVSA